MYIGKMCFCWSYKPSESVLSLLYVEWYNVEKKVGQMEFMPVKGFQF